MRTRASPSPAPGVLSNDTDVLADVLSVGHFANGFAVNVGTEITLPSGAKLTVQANGSYTYNPNGAFDYLDTGEGTTDSFTYAASDGTALSNTALVTITITGVNDAPVATVLITPANPNTNAVLTANTTTSDADGDTVTLTYVWKVNGTVVVGATTDTFDLCVAGHGDKGDVVSVEVTPNDGTADGLTAGHSVTVANTAPVVTASSSHRRARRPTR